MPPTRNEKKGGEYELNDTGIEGFEIQWRMEISAGNKFQILNVLKP